MNEILTAILTILTLVLLVLISYINHIRAKESANRISKSDRQVEKKRIIRKSNFGNENPFTQSIKRFIGCRDYYFKLKVFTITTSEKKPKHETL